MGRPRIDEGEPAFTGPPVAEAFGTTTASPHREGKTGTTKTLDISLAHAVVALSAVVSGHCHMPMSNYGMPQSRHCAREGLEITAESAETATHRKLTNPFDVILGCFGLGIMLDKSAPVDDTTADFPKPPP